MPFLESSCAGHFMVQQGKAKVQASGSERILKTRKNSVPSILSNFILSNFLTSISPQVNISVRDIVLCGAEHLFAKCHLIAKCCGQISSVLERRK